MSATAGITHISLPMGGGDYSRVRAEKCQKWHLFFLPTRLLTRLLPYQAGWARVDFCSYIAARLLQIKKPYETSDLICNPISHEAFTQKWTRAINDFYVEIAAKRMAQMKRKLLRQQQLLRT